MGFFKVFLFPFSWLYDTITSTRNYLFDIGYKKEFEFHTNVIGVGNLAVGGTGKSPMVEYLIDLLNREYSLATLSRGYGRKTSGFRIATQEDGAGTIGDEPYQFYRKYPNITVSVCEERAVAIPTILAEKEPDVIIMDDSYQHRYVRPSLNILLSDYSRPFYKDHLLPYGRLRESRKGAQRANGIVITKCPPDLENTEMDIIKEEVRKYSGADIYFSKIEYQLPISFRNQETLPNKSKIIGFAGLANDTIFKRHLAEQYDLLYYQSFSDHHDYKVSHIEMIGKKLSDYEDQQVSIVTTEKDMVKLLDNTFLDHITSLPFYYLPIKHEFIQDGNVFDKLIFQSIKNYSNQAFT